MHNVGLGDASNNVMGSFIAPATPVNWEQRGTQMWYSTLHYRNHCIIPPNWYPIYSYTLHELYLFPYTCIYTEQFSCKPVIAPVIANQDGEGHRQLVHSSWGSSARGTASTLGYTLDKILILYTEVYNIRIIMCMYLIRSIICFLCSNCTQ